ncbi:MAG: Di- and tricarboxylate transporter [Candidatus Electronema aureum]|uniref:Di-and tricarboxylate transporter n=1 Tax=Candidatus Electronema aureum TaxID=2005002 RepID=A0A521G5Q1_9BACT|nr:MAG: Di- and tricarboxylate transporter [Candidatus Electronema aureum]
MSQPSSKNAFQILTLLLSIAGVVFLQFAPISAAAKASSIALLTLAFWATALIPEHLTALLFFLLAMLFSVAPKEIVFSGFFSAAVWLVFGGLVIGAAISSTGLGGRIGRYAATQLHGSYVKIIGGLVAAVVLFSFLMPSSMGRVVLLIPIALSIADHFGFREGSKGRTGIMLAVILGTYIPAFGILPANVPNVVLAGMAETKYKISLLYGSYLLLHFPLLTLAKAVIIAALIVFFYPDKAVERLEQNQNVAGPLTRNEMILSAVLPLMLMLWLTDFFHHISPAWIALGGAFFLMMPGIDIVSTAQFNQKLNWASIFFTAGILGLGGMIGKTGLDRIFADALLKLLPLAPQQDFINYMSISIASALTGIVTTLPAVPAVFTPLTDSLAQATGLKTESLLMMQVTGFATVLLPYQGPPIVVGLQLAGEKLSSAAKICVPLALVTVFVLLPINFFWWKVLDWL